MTPKQKRTMNQLRKALVAVAAETVDDAELVNPATALLLRTVGAMIGTMTAAQAMSTEDLHGALTRASRYMAEEAAQAHGIYLATEKQIAKGGH